jgi:phosphopantetheinyl transferase (holo-ACP synthase)
MGLGLNNRYKQRGIGMVKERERVTVHTINPVHRRGPAFYASLPCGPGDTDTSTGHGMSVEETKRGLVSALWEHLARMKSPLWTRCQSFNEGTYPIQVVCGRLGRPYLLLGEYRGPAISFSEGGGKVWAALCGDMSEIGIDVAGQDEFQREYPVHRVFHPEELHHAVKLIGGDLEKASALLWSIKEAVVKALGCAFHLVDPRQISVYPSVSGDGYISPVGLSGKAQMRFPLAARGSLWVRSLPQREMWLSIALLDRRPAGHE